MDPVDPIGETQLSTCPEIDRLIEMVSGRLDSVHQRELEAHIDRCDGCRIGIASLVREGREQTAPWSLGRYVIRGVLGAGGMGVVYRAFDPALARDLAIKVVKSGGDELLDTRLEREARNLARLNHPNVCQVYDVGRDDGELWIAMELIDGTTFDSWLALGTRPRGEIVAMLAGIARGLEAAHRAGLVHRDIKPGNVLIDRSGRPVVTDFGLAQASDGTRSYVLAGTPAYMAPEQLEGSPADARSDQYAFAVMAHEALVGARPRPRNAASTTLEAPLRAALDRGLADDPAARYPSIAAVVDAIAAAIRGRPAPRRRWPLVAGTAALLAGAVAVVISSRGESPASRTDAAPVIPGASLAPADAALGREAAVEIVVASPPDAAVAPAAPARRPAGPAPIATARSGDAGTYLAAANRHVGAGDGKACMADFAALDRVGSTPELAATAEQIRASCLMLAGQCQAGRARALAAEQANHVSDREAERRADALVAYSCHAGDLTDRDRLLRAFYLLRDKTHTYSLAECRAAYDDARRLVPTARPRDPQDMLYDPIGQLRVGGPACFARAGDCAAAWTAAKEIDLANPNGGRSTDASRRATFAWAVGATCADQDQGQLGDAEAFERAVSELEHVKQLGTPTAAFCATRISRALATLPSMTDHGAGSRLSTRAATCLAVVGDCAAAWPAFSELRRALGDDDTKARDEFATKIAARIPSCSAP